VAAALAVVQPGFGHAYLREWLRALLWFGLWVWTFALVVPLSPVAVPPSAFLRALPAAVTDLSLPAAFALASVVVFGTLDAYRLALRADAPDEEGPTCPHCGREIDPSLDFCHWCTARLDRPDAGESRA
jgi:hypothetical protein